MAGSHPREFGFWDIPTDSFPDGVAEAAIAGDVIGGSDVELSGWGPMIVA